MTCELKPGSEVCLSAVGEARYKTTCNTCPAVAKTGGAVCESDKPTTTTKKSNALAAIASVQKLLKEAAKSKAPPELSDGTGHLSDRKARARSPDPTVNDRTKTFGTHTVPKEQHGFVGSPV